METLKGVFTCVLWLSLSGSLLLGVVWMVNRLFRKKISPTFSYYIWLLVFLRLVIPYQADWGAAAVLMEHPFPLLMEIQNVGETDGTSELGNNQVSDGREHLTASSLRTNWQKIIDRQEELLEQQGWASEHPAYFHYERRDAFPREEWDQGSAGGTLYPSLGFMSVSLLADCLTVLWLIGMTAVFSSRLWQYGAFRRALKISLKPADDPQVTGLYRRVKREVVGAGRGGRVELCFSKEISSPLLTGIVRPVMVIPKNMTDQFASEEKKSQLAHAFRHEWTHYKRRDLHYKWMVQIVTAIHWFNPLVHLLARKTAEDCELSCDEAVCGRLSGEERIGYGEALLASVSKGKENGACVSERFCTSMGKDGRAMMERLKVVKEARRLSRARKGLCVTLAAALCLTAVWLGMGELQAMEKEPFGSDARRALGELASTLVVDEEAGALQFTVPEENMDVIIKVSCLLDGEVVQVEDYFRDQMGIGSFLPGVVYTAPLYRENVLDFQIQLSASREDEEGGLTAWSVFMDKAALDVLYEQVPYPDWQTAYTAVVRELSSQVEYPTKWLTAEEIQELRAEGADLKPFDKVLRESAFGLHDMDGDGVPELLVKAADAQGKGWDGCYVYTFKNDQPQYLGNAYGEANVDYGVIISCDSQRQPPDETVSDRTRIEFYEITDISIHDLQAMMSFWEIQQDGGSLTEEDKAILEAANRWARAYASREGIVRYNLLTEEKQAVFFQEDKTIVSDEELFWEMGFISLRGSSPWVEEFSLRKTGDNKVQIRYFMRTSAPGDYYVMDEELQFGRVNGELKVVEYETLNMIPLEYFFQPLTFEEALKVSLRRTNNGMNRAGSLAAEGWVVLSDEQQDGTRILSTALMAGKFDLEGGELAPVSDLDIGIVTVTLYQLESGGYMPGYTSRSQEDEDRADHVFGELSEEEGIRMRAVLEERFAESLQEELTKLGISWEEMDLSELVRDGQG